VQATIFNGLIAISFFYLTGAFSITPKTNLVIFSAFFFLLFIAFRALSADVIRGKEHCKRLAFLGLSDFEENLVREAISESVLPMIEVPFNDYYFDALIAGQKAYTADQKDLYESVVRGREVTDLVSFLEAITNKIPITLASTDWFINKFALVQDREYVLVKRIFDVFLSVGFLIFFALPMLIISTIIKLSSHGPVLYKQTRTGKNGISYVLYKFRSMTIDAEINGAQWSQKNDNRVTKIGKILRHTHLDELPQLWNILVGEMSFVGPRPERPEMISLLNTEIPFYSLRHLVKPGVTGWAQINYPYGASVEDAKNKLAYDLYYVKHRAFFWDIRIIVKTLATMVRGEGR